MAIIPVVFQDLDLSSYDGLKKGVIAYLNRVDLTGNAPAFIQQHEAKMNRELRVRDMIQRVETVSTGQFVALPVDFLQHYSLRLAPGSQIPSMEPLNYIPDREKAIYEARKVGGPTRYYTMDDGVFALFPAPASDLQLLMSYYARIPSLGALTSDPTPVPRQTNWLLQKAPDLYVVGSCLEAQSYLKDDARLSTWATIRSGIMVNMDVESERAKRPDSYLVARRRGF